MDANQTDQPARPNAASPTALPVEEYNYRHFRTRDVLRDAEGTLHRRGIQPGELAPDFELPRVRGGTLRLSALRDKPVLLHFGSFT